MLKRGCHLRPALTAIRRSIDGPGIRPKPPIIAYPCRCIVPACNASAGRDGFRQRMPGLPAVRRYSNTPVIIEWIANENTVLRIEEMDAIHKRSEGRYLDL